MLAGTKTLWMVVASVLLVGCAIRPAVTDIEPTAKPVIEIANAGGQIVQYTADTADSGDVQAVLLNSPLIWLEEPAAPSGDAIRAREQDNRPQTAGAQENPDGGNGPLANPGPEPKPDPDPAPLPTSEKAPAPNPNPQPDPVPETGQAANPTPGSVGHSSGGPGSETAPGEPQSVMWEVLYGIVQTVDELQMTLLLDDGQTMVVQGAEWAYARENGFVASAGERVALIGFLTAEEDFVVGILSNISSGLELLIRDEAGRPMWSGGERADP